MRTLKDVARYVRSKNAGPFWVTVDIFCDTPADLDAVAAAPALKAEAVAAVYGVEAAMVRVFKDVNLRVLKISFPRPQAQGSGRDADSHAGQQFVPLLAAPV